MANQKIGLLLVNHGSHSATWRKTLLEVETIDAQQFQALMRGENPFPPTETPTPRMTAPGSRQDEAPRGTDKRTDNGVDLGGTIPAPA